MGAPLWRANAHHSRAPLFNPQSEPQSEPQPEDVTKACVAQGDMPYIRSERQCLIRLPVSRAVLFSIHTYLVPLAALTADQAAALRDFPIHTAL